MLVAVTGASGHLGACLVRMLVARGDRVRALIFEGDATSLDGVDVERFAGDVRDRASLDAAFDGVDAVVHLAAMISIHEADAERMNQVNVGGTRNVVEACRSLGVGRLVHVSSIHAVDPNPANETVDESRPLADGPSAYAYDRSKAKAERVVFEAAQSGLNALIVSPSGMLGPFDFALSYLGRFLVDVHLGAMPVLIEGGFNWVDVRDVTAAIVSSLEHGRAGEKYLLAGEWVSMMDLARHVSEVTGTPPPAFAAPLALCKAIVPFAEWLVTHVLGTRTRFTPAAMHALRTYESICSDKASRELGFSARPVRETILDTLLWLEARGALAPKTVWERVSARIAYARRGGGTKLLASART